MKNNDDIFRRMKNIASKMELKPFGGRAYRTLLLKYQFLAKKIGIDLPSKRFISSIKRCKCGSVEISINTEKGKCCFKCTNCGISTGFHENKLDTRDEWNELVKLT